MNCRVCVCQFKLSCFSLDSADKIWKSNAITSGDTPVQIRTKQPQSWVYKEKGEKDSTGIRFLSSYFTRSISLIISINSKYIKLSHGQKCPISTGQKVYKLLKKYRHRKTGALSALFATVHTNTKVTRTNNKSPEFQKVWHSLCWLGAIRGVTVWARFL